jgi:hypothetical protein
MIKSNVTDRRPRSEKFQRKIKLISGGYACPEAFPNGEIVVLPWDSDTDRWLTEASQTSKHRDRLLFDLMARLCILGPCKLEEFVMGDVNTILLVSRAIAEMNKVQYLTICPACAEEEIDEITVPDELKPVGQKSIDYKGTDTVTLDESKDVVEVRPLRIKDNLEIAGRTPEAKALIDDHLAHIIAPIVSIGGGQPDRLDELVQWYRALHPHDAKQLQDFQDANTPHLSQEIAQECSRCKHLYPFHLRLDTDFFRSGRVGTAGRALAADI